MFQHGSGDAADCTESEVVRWFSLCAPALGLMSTSYRNPPEWLHQPVNFFTVLSEEPQDLLKLFQIKSPSYF